MADQDEKISTAAELRHEMAELEHEKLRRYMLHKDAADRAFRDYVDHFLHDHLVRKDFKEMRRKVLDAARHGRFETMVMRFPSALCTDDGRAVNNQLEGWESTLPGKAHEAYEVWRQVGRDKGFRLIARVLDYPDGKPGDVGLFVSWAPPVMA